jgi:hypothetical protein
MYSSLAGQSPPLIAVKATQQFDQVFGKRGILCAYLLPPSISDRDDESIDPCLGRRGCAEYRAGPANS